MAQANVTPARALARLMVAAFVAIVMTLALTINAVGIADPSGPSAATASASASTAAAP